MGMLDIALMLFLIANPIGGIPVFVALVKDFEFKKQISILFREAVISMLIAYFFLYLGEPFVKSLCIDTFAIKLGGGIIIFLIAAKMIFPVHSDSKGTKGLSQEPFIVPIAIPLISGAGVFASMMIAAKQAPLHVVSMAVLIAWIGVIFFVVSAAFFQKILGKRGLIALEQLMGMILMMLGVELFLSGITLFATRVHGV
jgi:multiple antibiotic resistance protein